MSAKIHHFQENRENNRGIHRETHRKSHRGNGRPARYRQDNTGGTPVPPALNTGGTPMPPAQAAFSLIEILVAMAVLAMLMTFMFSMVGGTSRLWERGNAKIEAAQAARVGLNRMTEDLLSALSASEDSSNPTKTSVVPFLAEANVSSGSDRISGIRLTGNPANPFTAFQYSCEFVGNPGKDAMRGNRYYLIQGKVASNTTGSISFFLQGGPASSWTNDFVAAGRTSPLIDNCVRLEMEYYDIHGGGFTKSWGSQTNLPDGVLVTIIVIDSRTAERVEKIQPQLSSSDIDSITNASPPSPGVQSILRGGSVVMRRFIPFNNHQH